MNRFPRDDAGRLHLHALALGVFDRAFAVDRIAETVDHAAEQALADGNIDDRAGTADGVAFLEGGVRAEDHDTDIVGLEDQRPALDSAIEFDHFAGLAAVEAVDTWGCCTPPPH